MKLENQVCTLEQAKRLRDLGITQGKTPFTWDARLLPALLYDLDYEASNQEGFDVDQIYAAFTVAELRVMLPDEIGCTLKNGTYELWAPDDVFNLANECTRKGIKTWGFKSEAEALTTLLIHMLQIDFIAASEVNSRLAAA